MKAKLFLILMLCVSALTSCRTEDTHEFIEGSLYIFSARKCNYVFLHNVKDEYRVSGDYTYRSESYMEKGETVSIDNYVLEFSTCNVGMDMIMSSLQEHYPTMYESYMAGREDSLKEPLGEYVSYYDDADKEIENKLHVYFYGKTRTILKNISYRTTPIKDLKITSSVKIGNVEAGEALNNLLEVAGYSGRNYFIITANKDLITEKDRIYNIGIDQYLSYHPMAPAGMKLKFRDGVKIDEPVDACFQIELTTDDGRVLKAESRHITLVP